MRPCYWQFYLRRGDAEWTPDRVSEDGYESRLDAIDGFVVVITSMYGNPTEVVVEVDDGEPSEIIADAEHVAEVSVTGQGSLVLLNWDDSMPPCLTVEVPSGPLRIRGSWIGMSAEHAHPDRQATSEVLSPEHVTLQVWSAP